jgi:homoserine O-acetyltransferase
MHSIKVSADTKFFDHQESFRLESGQELPGFRLAYSIEGRPNASQDNVVWVFHALTANSHPMEWWPGLIGDGKLIDTASHCIICVNMPSSCYGSSGPLDTDPRTGRPFFHDFPLVTTRDMARCYTLLKEALGIHRIALGIGGSMGGQQLLEWAVLEPELFDHIVPIATNAYHSAWGKAFNASQRMCIETDATWKEDRADAGLEGMKVARAMALISYRHYSTYAATQVDDPEALEHYRSESYQRYQGEKLAQRFNAFSYHALTRSMDAHHLGRGRGGSEKALQSIQAKTCVIGIDTDILYPLEEQAFIASHIPGAKLETMHSLYGHDGFLLEYTKLETILRKFLPHQFF